MSISSHTNVYGSRSFSKAPIACSSAGGHPAAKALLTKAGIHRYELEIVTDNGSRYPFVDGVSGFVELVEKIAPEQWELPALGGGVSGRSSVTPLGPLGDDNAPVEPRPRKAVEAKRDHCPNHAFGQVCS